MIRRLIGLIVLAVALPGCGSPQHITYRITGTTKNVDITMSNASGGTEQRNTGTPWYVTFDATGGRTLYISAQNKWDAGTVTCEILIDDKMVQTATATAAYGIATCSGSL